MDDEVAREALDELDPELVDVRRDLHAHPELSRLERRTSQLVADRLKLAGLQPQLLEGTGVVADIGAEHPAYRVALRADLVALAEDAGRITDNGALHLDWEYRVVTATRA